MILGHGHTRWPGMKDMGNQVEIGELSSHVVKMVSYTSDELRF